MNSPLPSNLELEAVRLKFEKIIHAEPGGELVPYFHFRIIIKNGTDVGHINFKVGNTRHIIMCVGHIGFEIEEKYRGNAYAYYACKALKPLILQHFKKIILTSDPENRPSLKTIEKLGARYLEEIEVPPDDPSYKSGSLRKKRFEWVL
ncbi:GNAT family N-acetyltransferase [Marinomonas mediterranea]|jgi:Predicted acetyltransferase|uniref:GCN5-related N-acetyltransferase n=1 Tax=Marinomonas mediterranea (strain ATCC 700492 / JCM 21426 / NBRC 103028 / MMB-1) TaxID=717774 RepID=F2JYG9_MARM1|nr:GNAT family N-acetyltransferase [Marinomonas mediterranea]ADZ93098.1 GCN5-related N-acetyltransferase [Marinomonas mediterranea MMB-1]WCN19108.1 GNAT family N-acetyltransferase [Marinomonas mediterranea MMB-1]